MIKHLLEKLPTDTYMDGFVQNYNNLIANALEWPVLC